MSHANLTIDHMPVQRLTIAFLLMIAGVCASAGSALAQTTTTPGVATTTPAPTQQPTTAPTARPTLERVTATPTPAAQPALTLSTQQGLPGSSVAALGANFAPGEAVNLMFNGSQVDSANANTGGIVNFEFSVPSLASGDYQVVAAGQNRSSNSVKFSVAGSELTLSTEQGPPGTSLTVTGKGFQPGETVAVTFNGSLVDTTIADTTGSFQSTFAIPNLSSGDYAIEATGQTSNLKDTETFAIAGTTVSLSTQSAAVGASLTVTGSGFVAGDAVQLLFNGALIDSSTADTNGAVMFTFVVPRVAPGSYLVVLSGRMGGLASAPLNVTPGTAPSQPVAPTPTAVATQQPQAAPPVPHDARYFAQTGFRIDDDNTYAFFQSNGGVETFGYPTSRTFGFLGCPVQFFQRQVIQVCASQGAALLNILDPGIFPYTKVNGSTFPAPDEALKADTPAVSDPNYNQNISAFVAANVPNTYGGQPVNFLDYFNSQGGLTIWGAPISTPAPDPANSSFVYQRFQRGIMHFIQGSGTQSILVADYLKALILNQNVPPDLLADATTQESPYLNSYCPGAPNWMCRPGQVPGTDYTYAFVPD